MYCYLIMESSCMIKRRCACALQALVRVPDHLTHEEASTLPCVHSCSPGLPICIVPNLRLYENRCAALTAYSALLGPIPVKAGDYVLVQGTGGVSMYAAHDPLSSFNATYLILWPFYQIWPPNRRSFWCHGHRDFFLR